MMNRMYGAQIVGLQIMLSQMNGLLLLMIGRTPATWPMTSTGISIQVFIFARISAQI